MKVTITTILAVLFFINQSNAQPFTFYQTNDAPKVIKPGTVSDTLLNPFAGGLNNPQFSNIDWNGDGLNDLFVFDKETLRPVSFLYNSSLKKFVHAPIYEGGFRNYFTGWAFLRDMNADGKPDLVCSSSNGNKVTKFPTVNDGTKVQLFINKQIDGKTRFEQHSNILNDTGMYIGAPYNQQLSPTDLPTQNGSIIGIDDMDGDGDVDFLLNQGLETRLIYYENLQKNRSNIVYSKDSIKIIGRDYCWGFMNYNYSNNSFYLGLDRNTGSFCDYHMWYDKKATRHVDQASTMIDLNGDGIKDIVFGDFEFKSLVALINGRLEANGRYDSIVRQDTLFLSKNQIRRNFIGYPASYYVDIDADGKQELVVTTAANMAEKTANNIWTFDATRVNSILEFTERSGTDFLYNEMIDLGTRAVPNLVDIDADGDADLIVATSGNLGTSGNNNDRLFFYKNIGTTSYPVFELVDSNFANLSQLSTGLFAAHPTFGDINGDGKPDLLIGEGNGNLVFFKNESTGNSLSFELVNRNWFGILNGTYATPQFIDFDKDGLLDIICGQANGTVQYYKNTGTVTTPQFATIPTIDSLGKICTRETKPVLGFNSNMDALGYSTPHILDIDGDNVWDMACGSINGQVYIYKGVKPFKDSVATRVINTFGDEQTTQQSSLFNKRFGVRNTVTSAKLNSDSFPDLILGTLSGGLIYLSTKPSPVNGVNDFKVNNKAIELYPNPASTSFSLKLNEQLTSDATYTLHDLMGRKIKEGELRNTDTEPTIATDDIPAGLFLFKLTTSKWQATQRIVISK